MVKLGRLRAMRAPPEQFRTIRRKATGEVIRVPAGIEPGFDFIPDKGRGGSIKPGAPGGPVDRTANQLALKVEKTPELKPIIDSKGRVPDIPAFFSEVKGFNAKLVQEILDKVPGARREVDLLRRILDRSKVQTLGLKASTMRPIYQRSSKAGRYVNQIGRYLGIINDDIDLGSGYSISSQAIGIAGKYTAWRMGRALGWTRASSRHVIVKVKAGRASDLSKVNADKLRQGVLQVLEDVGSGEKFRVSGPSGWQDFRGWWGFADRIAANPDIYGHGAEALLVWIHEIGHQIHFLGGTRIVPSLLKRFTAYSFTNGRAVY